MLNIAVLEHPTVCRYKDFISMQVEKSKIFLFIWGESIFLPVGIYESESPLNFK